MAIRNDEASASPIVGLLEDGSAAGSWELDPRASSVGFEVKHFWGMVTVRGRFTGFEGNLAVDRTGTASGTMRIDAASVTTGNGMRDKHLRAEEFFDVAHHPLISFSGSAAGPEVTGDLTVAGRSRPIRFTADLGDVTADRVLVDARISVDRTDWGMTWSPMGTASARVLVIVHAELVRPVSDSNALNR
jgi:polyisoprenoid-binding protein YceI